jgi:nucleotide-binding universal stress UspA family protein
LTGSITVRRVIGCVAGKQSAFKRWILLGFGDGGGAMTYATIMVHVDFDAATEGRVRLAVGVADHFKSRLIGIAAIAPLFTRDNPDELKVALDEQEHQFRLIASKGSRQVEWRSAFDPPTEFLAREARAADLMIIGRQHLFEDPYRSLNPGALLLRVGRPVLVVPNGLDRLRADRVAVAWKDTREARRVLPDSLPFLHDAEKLFLVEIREDPEIEDSEHRVSDVMNYLTRHRVTTSAVLMLQAANVTDELLHVVRTKQIDLLVAGAYGHSRLGEWVFGGVTRELLCKSPVCCLLSH